MKKINYNLFFNNTSKQFSERGFECILAIALSTAILTMLLFFPIAGIALAIFAGGFLCVGVKGYLLNIAKNEVAQIEQIFNTFKICIKAFCLKVATILISALWSLVFIIPGIITALNYSMASFVMAEEGCSSLESMVKSKKLVNGYRGEILISYLAYIFVIIATMCICAGLGIAIKYYTNINIAIPVIGMCLLFLFIFFVFIVPYFELMFANIYLELKKLNKEKQTARKSRVKLQEIENI